jgi:hypothetical protein
MKQTPPIATLSTWFVAVVEDRRLDPVALGRRRVARRLDGRKSPVAASWSDDLGRRGRAAPGRMRRAESAD